MWRREVASMNAGNAPLAVCSMSGRTSSERKPARIFCRGENSVTNFGKFRFHVQISDMRGAPAYALVRMDRRAFSHDRDAMNELEEAFRELFDQSGFPNSCPRRQWPESVSRQSLGRASSGEQSPGFSRTVPPRVGRRTCPSRRARQGDRRGQRTDATPVEKSTFTEIRADGERSNASTS